MSRPTIHEKATLLGDVVFAADDGIITTFAVVAGAVGASLPSGVIIILGFANLFADALSMASGHYLGVKSEIDYQKAEGDNKDLARSPLKHGLVIFVSFVLAGLIPLIPYLLNLSASFLASALLVAASLFAIGAIRAYLAKKNILSGGLEMFIVGGLAAVIAYFVGLMLRKYVVV